MAKNRGWYQEQIEKLKKDNVRRLKEVSAIEYQASRYVPGRYDSRIVIPKEEMVSLIEGNVKNAEKKYSQIFSNLGVRV